MAWVVEPDEPVKLPRTDKSVTGGWVAEPDKPAARPSSPGLMSQAAKAIADELVPPDPRKPIIVDRLANMDWKGFVSDMIPKKPSHIGEAAGPFLPSILQALPYPAAKAAGRALSTPAGRTLTTGAAATAGGLMEGQGTDALDTGVKALGVNSLAEGAGAVVGKGARSLPFVKGRIAESQAGRMTDAIRLASPELADVIGGAKGRLSPTLKGGKTSAAMQSAALTDQGQNALSAAFDRGMTEVDRLAPGAFVMGPALLDAYMAMPQLAREKLIGTVATSGFTPRQAQEVISWVGSKAFSEAPLGQGVGKVPQQKLWADALNESVGGLRAVNPAAADVFVRIRAPYAGGEQYLDMLRSGSPEGPFRGYPNRIMLDENMVRRYVSENRQALIDKLGPRGFQALNDALGGAQPGTKSLLTPGAGGPLDALMATLGRGTNTGTMSLPGGVIRAPLSNVGSQYTGRAPYSVPPMLQAILDAAAQRGVSRLAE